ncbi:MAG: 23S rRNA (adenine(2503)-C(2))-methyltransferase RlmN [Candidatus Omnitrophica bacterium]|nr:23S rRNA (adenine(2503)-C(2))-methyltransferase RlmN [Candidatus Omnitrophota bacterium]
MSNQSLESLFNYTPHEIQQWLKERGHPAYRAKQLLQWIYQRRAASFDEMTDLSKPLRDELQGAFSITVPPVRARQEDSADGTVKCLFELRDGECVEAVLMPRYGDGAKTDPRTGAVKNRKKIKTQGYTTCITTQVGCMFACRFCASGQMGLKRNMTADEIIAQVMAFHRSEPSLSRIVFMGTGEPLHNYDHLKRAIDILTDPSGPGFSPRRITVSTVGLAPEIYRMAKEGWKVKLAVSLHATTDAKRAEIIPLARSYQLDQLKDAILYYQRSNGRRISLEYLMLGGVNDSRKDAERLLRFCEGFLCHVTLIPYNAVSKSEFRSSSQERMQLFKDCLRRGKIDATVRYSRGRNIDAACGQLRLRHEREQAA